ncbi:cache domain-containing protein [Parvibaculum sp.]|uniref:cache domain-containing protein n=1 Tax=Parvibaculum sp. TaxID=2024848 RepID=UPI003210C376
MIRALMIALAFMAFTATASAASKAVAASDDFSTDGRMALGAYRALAEDHLAGILAAERALAATSDARSADWARIKPALSSLAKGITTEAAVWYALPDGRYYTADGDLSKESLKDRTYFPDLLAGKAVEGVLVISKSTGHRSIIVAAPVTKDGKIVGAVGVSVRARLLASMIVQKARMPDNFIFYALDGEGRTAIHKDPDRMFEHPADIGDPSLRAAVNTILKTPRGVVAYEFRGKRRKALFETSEISGWHFILARSEP